jgi:L-threonylcarbamoyladenylate synthase
VLEDLDGRIDAVLDGGATSVGVESTVLAPLETPMLIYRPGAVTARMIEEATGCAVEVFRLSPQDEDAPREGLPSPGVGIRHYAPRARLELVGVPLGAGGAGEVSHSLHAVIERLEESDEVVGVMLPEGWDSSYAEECFPLGEWGDEETFAQRLFAGLRALDARGVSVIVCPVPVGQGLGAAVRDRLEKAARR